MKKLAKHVRNRSNSVFNPAAASGSSRPAVMRSEEVSIPKMAKWFTAAPVPAYTPDEEDLPSHTYDLRNLAPFAEAQEYPQWLMKAFMEHVESESPSPAHRRVSNLPRGVREALSVEMISFTAKQGESREAEFIDQRFPPGTPVILGFGPGQWLDSKTVVDGGNARRAISSRPYEPHPDFFSVEVAGSGPSGPSEPFRVLWTFCESFKYNAKMKFGARQGDELPGYEAGEEEDQDSDSASVWFIRKLDSSKRQVQHNGRDVGCIVVFTDNRQYLKRTAPSHDPRLSSTDDRRCRFSHPRALGEVIHQLLCHLDAEGRDESRWSATEESGHLRRTLKVLGARVSHRRMVGSRTTVDYNLPYLPSNQGSTEVPLAIPTESGRSASVTAEYIHRHNRPLSSSVEHTYWLLTFNAGSERLGDRLKPGAQVDVYFR